MGSDEVNGPMIAMQVHVKGQEGLLRGFSNTGAVESRGFAQSHSNARIFDIKRR